MPTQPEPQSLDYCGRYADHEAHTWRYDGDTFDCPGVE